MRTQRLNWIIALLLVAIIVSVVAILSACSAIRSNNQATAETWRDVDGFSLPVNP